MKEYYVDIDVTSVHGTQTWKTKARTKKEALSMLKEGLGTFVNEELDVEDTNMNEIVEKDLYVD